jgi:hypothetical protein
MHMHAASIIPERLMVQSDTISVQADKGGEMEEQVIRTFGHANGRMFVVFKGLHEHHAYICTCMNADSPQTHCAEKFE